MVFSHMEARMKLLKEITTPNELPRFERPSDFSNWRHKFENYIALNDPELLVFMLKQYCHSTMEKDYEKEKRAFATIKMSLSKDARDLFTREKTSYDLWEAIAERFGDRDKLRSNSPDEGIKEKLLKKDEKIQALQSRILTMENEREEMRSRIVGLESRIVEFEDQQKGVTKLKVELEDQHKVVTMLKVDHDLALKNVQDLREQIANVSPTLKTPVTRKKKISTEKSSEPLLRMVRSKRISQFTNYSLQKNMKYSEKSQSTRKCVHQKVDCCDDSGYSLRVKSSVLCQTPKGAFKPTQLPESRQTKSCVYTRAQMFALAPPRSHHMVQKRRKDFVPFSPKKNRLALIPQHEFRHETTRFNFRWNTMSLDYIDDTYRWFSKISGTIGTVLQWVPKAVV